MLTAHQIIRKYVLDNDVDMNDFYENYVREYQVPEHEMNAYDSRYLSHLESYVEERNERMALHAEHADSVYSSHFLDELERKFLLEKGENE